MCPAVHRKKEKLKSLEQISKDVISFVVVFSLTDYCFSTFTVKLNEWLVTEPVLLFFVFAVTVIYFVCDPWYSLEENFAFITPSFPGMIGSSGFSATVQPQPGTALSMTNGLSPVFLK